MGTARPARCQSQPPPRRRLLAIPITTGASHAFSGAASHAGGPSATARTAASRAATPFTGAYGTQREPHAASSCTHAVSHYVDGPSIGFATV